MSNYRKKDQPEDHAEILPETLKKLKAAVAKYENYDDFLLSQMAIKKVGNRPVVLKYNISQMPAYEATFIAPYITGMNDEFIFAKYARLKTKKEVATGKWDFVNTDWFMPRLFWDYVRSA